jgi:hypothetical protein
MFRLRETDNKPGYELVVSNDLARPQTVEIELPLDAKGIGKTLVKREGWMLWRVTLPANGHVTLRWHV